MSSNRYYFGDIIEHTPEGDVVRRMAMVLQRRETVDMHGNKVIHQVVGCPYCDGHHEHSDGPGFNGPNCGGCSELPRSDYLVMPTPLRPVPRGTAYPKRKKRRRAA